MIYDILEVFKKEYEKSGDKLILGSYTLKDGLYVKIDKYGKCEYFEAKTVKKEKVFITADGVEDSKAYDWFKERDYCSSISYNAKALDAPKRIIHNNNYLTLFMKNEIFINVDYNHIKNKLFNKVIGYEDFKSKNDKNILRSYCHHIKSLDRKKDLLCKYRTLEGVLDDIKELAKKYNPKNYVKLFFAEDMLMYNKESEIYFALKIFNDNKYSININKIVYGLSNSNMGLNTKKPYLENKTQKLSKPFMITNLNALFIQKFFDWLKFQNFNEKFPLNEYFFMNRGYENKEFVVKEFDYIPVKRDDVQRHFQSFKVKNYLTIKDKDKNILEDYEIKELYQLESKVDELFYNKQLIFNYYNDDMKVSQYISKELQKLLFITKYSMSNYFRKFKDESFATIIKKYGTAFIVDSLKNGRVFKAKEALNLKLAILENEGEDVMDIEKIMITIENRLGETGNYKELNRDEFLFLSGQWAYYLLSQSKTKDKTFALAEHYFRAKNITRLRSAINNDFYKYKHTINLNSNKAKKTISLIGAYEDDNKRFTSLEQDMFLVGFTVDNLFYKKTEEKKS